MIVYRLGRCVKFSIYKIELLLIPVSLAILYCEIPILCRLAHKTATMAAGQFLVRDSFSLAEFNYKTENGYRVVELNYGKEPIFGIRVENLPQVLYQKILAMHWSQPKEIVIDNVAVTDSSVCPETTNMDFIFTDAEHGWSDIGVSVARCGNWKVNVKFVVERGQVKTGIQEPVRLKTNASF